MIEELTLGIVSMRLPESGGGRFRKTLLSIQSSLLAVTLAPYGVLSIFIAIRSVYGCNSTRLHRSHEVQLGQKPLVEVREHAVETNRLAITSGGGDISG